MHRDWHFVWLTGWSAHPRVWDPVLRRFPDATHQRVDFNGCHHPKSVQSRAKKALLSSPKPVHLVGWSLGAMVALELASQFPKWIRALYLIGGTGQFVRDTTYPHGWDARILKRMERRLQTHPDEVLADFDRQLFSPAEQATGWSDQWRQLRSVTHLSPADLSGSLRYLRNFNWFAQGITLETDTYLLTGEADVICPPQAGEWLAKRIPKADWTPLPQAGHLPFWTQTDSFCSWLIQRVMNDDQ